MQEPQRSIDIHIPVSAAYDRWVRWEDQPGFMQSLKRPVPLRSHRVTAPRARRSDRVLGRDGQGCPVVWRAFVGSDSVGRVSFSSIGPRTTRVSVSVRWRRPVDDDVKARLDAVACERLEHELDTFAAFVASAPERVSASTSTSETPPLPEPVPQPPEPVPDPEPSPPHPVPTPPPPPDQPPIPRM